MQNIFEDSVVQVCSHDDAAANSFGTINSVCILACDKGITGPINGMALLSVFDCVASLPWLMIQLMIFFCNALICLMRVECYFL